jgi:prepilin-type N-terminal cleavage/methylation domain-containing protein
MVGWMSSRSRGRESGFRFRSCGEGSGFSLVEMMVALFILSFGLLAAGQMMYVAVSSVSLARTKGNISIAAQDRLEYLADMYARDPGSADLTDGNHGPVQVQFVDPASHVALNRFQITWNVSTVTDPRPGKVLKAKKVEVTVRPIDNAGTIRFRVFSNKATVVVGIFSPST